MVETIYIYTCIIHVEVSQIGNQDQVGLVEMYETIESFGRTYATASLPLR